MSAKLNGLLFETACGTFRLEYLVDPRKDIDSNRWEYWLQFKWVDPHDGANKATPEYRLHLDLYEEDMLATNAEAELLGSLNLWIQSAPHDDDRHFTLRTTDNPRLKARATT